MSFKENLLSKIAIKRLTGTVAAAIGSVDSGKRIDRQVLDQLIAYFPWTHRQERDLDLYLESGGSGKTHILVLDNDLPIYHTTVDDVVLRKSPTVKEMISFRNAVKILSDKDVVVSKKEASLKTIQALSIGALDLNFTAADIERLAGEGAAALEAGDAKTVYESLILFAELLALRPAPKAFALKHHDSFGKVASKPGGETTFGPLVLFSRVHDTLTCLEAVLSSRDKARFERLEAVASGAAEAAASGATVFNLMAAKVLSGHPGRDGDQ